jgi:threonine dehydratase
MPHPVTLSDIYSARRRIAAHVRRTPLVESFWLSDACRAEVRLKLETLQVTCSFKSRGALNAALRVAESSGPGTIVATASAGNHGRALAWAAERLGLRAVVFTPRDAPRAKTSAIRRHGADLRADAASYEDAERQAQRFAADTGAVFISPYDHPDVVAGAGTVGLELIEDDPELDAVVVPIGGGGLVSGIAVATKGIKPSITVVGVEAEASQAFSAARAAGHVVRVEVGDTIADGLGGNIDPETITWPMVRDLVDRIVVVPETMLHEGIRGLVEEEHLIAEGAGVAAIAAVLSETKSFEGRRVAVILSGANIDRQRLARLLGTA